MNKKRAGIIVVETIFGLVVSLGAEFLIDKVKELAKKQSFDDSLVADLTVGELKSILKEET